MAKHSPTHLILAASAGSAYQPRHDPDFVVSVHEVRIKEGIEKKSLLIEKKSLLVEDGAEGCSCKWAIGDGKKHCEFLNFDKLFYRFPCDFSAGKAIGCFTSGTNPGSNNGVLKHRAILKPPRMSTKASFSKSKLRATNSPAGAAELVGLVLLLN